MGINFENTVVHKFLFWNKTTTKTKQESAKNFLAFQREHVFEDGKKSNTYTSGRTTKTYNDQNSINKSMFECADSDSNGKIDEKEYKTFLMKSISDGMIGEETLGFTNGLTQNGKASFNNSTSITANYKELIQVSDMYSKMLDMDKGIDKNKDGFLTQQEFNNSVALTLTTNSDKKIANKLYSKDSKPYDEKLKTMSSISNGIIGKINNTTEYKYTYNYLSGQYEMCYVTKPTMQADYKKLVQIADKYHEQINS